MTNPKEDPTPVTQAVEAADETEADVVDFRAFREESRSLKIRQQLERDDYDLDLERLTERLMEFEEILDELFDF